MIAKPTSAGPGERKPSATSPASTTALARTTRYAGAGRRRIAGCCDRASSVLAIGARCLALGGDFLVRLHRLVEHVDCKRVNGFGGRAPDREALHQLAQAENDEGKRERGDVVEQTEQQQPGEQ